MMFTVLWGVHVHDGHTHGVAPDGFKNIVFFFKFGLFESL